MLVKEFIGKLNSYNMDAEIEFFGGNDFEIELIDNPTEMITDEGNVQKIVFKIIEKPAEESSVSPTEEPNSEIVDNSEISHSIPG